MSTGPRSQHPACPACVLLCVHIHLMHLPRLFDVSLGCRLQATTAAERADTAAKLKQRTEELVVARGEVASLHRWVEQLQMERVHKQRVVSSPPSSPTSASSPTHRERRMLARYVERMH